MAEGQRSISSLWHAFLYDVDRATASLMYLLHGMESVRNSELAPYNNISPTHQQFAPSFPKLPYVGEPLSMSGPGFDLNEVLRREGEAEQLAFKGWVEQVYNHIWEGKYRNELKTALEGVDIIRPEGDPIGDFGHIRNDLIHKHGVASEEESGKCTVLKWFKPGEEIVLGMRHVFDFLNHMGFMTRMPGFRSGGGKHNIEIDLAPDLPWVMADRLRMVQVLGNLLTNAARHSPESSIIRVTAVGKGVHVAVSVSDEGRGIPAEKSVTLAVLIRLCLGTVSSMPPCVRLYKRADGGGRPRHLDNPDRSMLLS